MTLQPQFLSQLHIESEISISDANLFWADASENGKNFTTEVKPKPVFLETFASLEQIIFNKKFAPTECPTACQLDAARSQDIFFC